MKFLIAFILCTPLLLSFSAEKEVAKPELNIQQQAVKKAIRHTVAFRLKNVTPQEEANFFR